MTQTTTAFNALTGELDEDEYQKFLKQIAPTLYQAGQQAEQQLKMPAGIWDPEKFAEITAHLRQPYVEQGQKQLEAVTAGMRARGMADSTRHGKYLIEQAGQTQQQIAANVDVPLALEQLRQRDVAERATTQQAAQIGSQQFEAYQALRQMQLQEKVNLGQLTIEEARQQLEAEIQRGRLELEQAGITGRFRGETTLSGRELEQQQRQFEATLSQRRQEFNATLGQQKDEFAQRFGLSVEELGEAKRQYDLGYGLQDKQLEAQIGQFYAGLTEQQRQFNMSLGQRQKEFTQTLDQQKEEFSKQFGMTVEQLEEQKREFDLTREDRLLEMARRFGLDERLLGENIRQFDISTQVERERIATQADQFAQQLDLSRDQFVEAAEQFDISTEQEKNQFADSLGLSRDQLALAIDQFNAATDQDQQRIDQVGEQFAQRLGLEKDQFDEVKSQFDRGISQQDKELRARIDQFYAGLDQQKYEFDANLSLEERRLVVLQGQFDRQMDQQAEQFASTHGLQRDQFKQAVIQFDLGRTDQLTMFAEQMGLQRDQLQASIDQFTQQTGLRQQEIDNQAAQFADSLGLSRDQFQEARDQFRIRTDIEKEQFAETLGLSKDQLQASIDQFDAQTELQYAELDERKSQFSQQLGLSTRQFDEAIRQWDLEQITRTTEFGETVRQYNEGLKEQQRQFDQNLSHQERRVVIDELNSAVERAVAQSQATGQFIDPETGQSYETILERRYQLERDMAQAEYSGIWNNKETIDAAVRRAQLTGTFTDPQTGLSYQTLLDRQMELDQSKFAEAVRQFDVTTTLQQDQQTLQRLQLILQREEVYGGAVPITAADLGIDLSRLGQADATIIASIRGSLRTKLQSWIGRVPSDQEIDALLSGQAISTGAETLQARLAAKDQQFREAELTGKYGGELTLAGKQFQQSAMNAELDRALARARATGTFVDPVSGQSAETLESRKFQLEEAAITGLYQGTETFQAKLTKLDREFQEKVVFGYDREDGTHVYGTNELQLEQQRNAQLFEQKLLAGFRYVDPDTGEERRVMGRDEQIRDEREWQEVTRVGYDRVATDDQGNTLHDADGNIIMQHIEGTQELSGRLRDRELTLQKQGMDLQAAHQQAVLEQQTRQYEGYHKVRSFGLTDIGLSDAALKAAKQLGPMAFAEAVGPAAMQRLRGLLGGAEPTPEELGQLITGNQLTMRDQDGNPISNWINGTASLEEQRTQMQLTLQQNGFTQERAEREARQLYEEKVATGYLGSWVDADGQTQTKWVRGTQEFQEQVMSLQSALQIDEAEAIWRLQEDSRTGYDQVVEVMGPTGFMETRTIHVLGTQEFQSTEAGLQRQLQLSLQQAGLDQETAEREAREAYAEEVRTGYDKTIMTPSGPRTVHVTGTEDFAKAMQARVDALTREGWTEQAARQKVDIQAQMTREFGGWQEQIGPTGFVELVWIEGSVEAQEHLLELQQQFVEDGWEHDDAVRAAQYVRDQATNNLGYLQQTYIQERMWHYQNVQGMTSQEASDAAMADWTRLDEAGVFGQQMSVELAQMQLAASQANFDAQVVAQNMAALISAGGQIVSGGLSWLFNPGAGGGPSFGMRLATLGSQGYAISADDVIRLATDEYGQTVTRAQAEQIAAGMTGGSLALGQQRAPIERFGSWVGAGVTSFGSWLSGGSLTGAGAFVTGAAVIGAVAYGAYKIYDWWRDNKRKDAAERKDFDEYLESIPDADYRHVRENIITGQPDLYWSDRGDVFRRMETALEKTDPEHWLTVNMRSGGREEQVDRAALDLLRYNPTHAPMQRMGGTLRSLLDKGAFEREDVSGMSLLDRDLLISAWRELPGQAKSSALGGYVPNNPSLAQLETVMRDVATFAAGMGVMDSEQAGDAFWRLTTSGALTRRMDELTVAELQLMDQLLVQHGHNPRLSTGVKQQILRNAAGLNEQLNSISMQAIKRRSLGELSIDDRAAINDLLDVFGYDIANLSMKQKHEILQGLQPISGAALPPPVEDTGRPPLGEPPPAEEEQPPLLDRINAAFNTAVGEAGYDPALDLNSDGVINSLDLGLANSGVTEPQPPAGGGEPPPAGVPIGAQANPAGPGGTLDFTVFQSAMLDGNFRLVAEASGIEHGSALYNNLQMYIVDSDPTAQAWLTNQGWTFGTVEQPAPAEPPPEEEPPPPAVLQPPEGYSSQALANAPSPAEFTAALGSYGFPTSGEPYNNIVRYFFGDNAMRVAAQTWLTNNGYGAWIAASPAA